MINVVSFVVLVLEIQDIVLVVEQLNIWNQMQLANNAHILVLLVIQKVRLIAIVVLMDFIYLINNVYLV